jgi:hypothetical protein
MCISYSYINAQLEGSPCPSSAILTLILFPSEEGAKNGRTGVLDGKKISERITLFRLVIENSVSLVISQKIL